MTETAVLICGHGSRDPEASAEFELVVAALRARLPNFDFATGYLEFARPTIRDGLAALAAQGAQRILAIPGMLFAASHVKNDLPREMNSFMADNPGIEVRLGAIWRSIRSCCTRPPIVSRQRRRPGDLARRDAACRRRARHQRPRRQFQHRQTRAHAVGRNGVRLGRDRV